MTDQTVLTCSCCGLPFAVVQRGVLVIQSRHHGQKHTNVIAVEDLRKLLAAAVEHVNARRQEPEDVLP